jgi:integrase
MIRVLMSLFKRGKIWYFDFVRNGIRQQGSTGLTNLNKARDVEATLKSEAALAKFGIAKPKAAPVFQTFMEGQFRDYVHRHAQKRRTAAFYDEKGKRLVDSNLRDLRLSEIDTAAIEKYCGRRKVAIATLNGELRTLRKALRLANEWGLIPRAPRIRQLPGENQRAFIVDAALERAYLDAASAYPLRPAAILIMDLGLRPEECLSLLKSEITADQCIVRGKTGARALPLTERAREAIAFLRDLWPDSEFLFPGRKGKHFSRKSLDNIHTKLRIEKGWPAEFVLYSFRHTYGTGLAESGASPFDIMKLMGHSKIETSQRYIHLRAEHLALAARRKEELDKIRRGETAPEISPTPTRK